MESQEINPQLNPKGAKAIGLYTLLGIVSVCSGIAACVPSAQVYAKDIATAALNVVAKLFI